MSKSYVKHLVSKKKKRYMEDGFDLDLAYIKPTIVAMGFPSENLEGVYRNNFDDVIRFLEQKHKDHYKVYNLCSEREYDPDKFHGRVCKFPFDDHNAPPFELIQPCCEDMKKWIEADTKNVAIVHCKAGKGRTGVMICSYLLYTEYFNSAKESMDFYAEARTNNLKGVTIPSQRRYITYFGYYMKQKLDYKPKTVLLNSITFVGIPTFNSGSCSPSFVVYQTKVMLYKSKNYEVKKSDNEFKMDLTKPLPVCGDIKIDMFHKDIFKKERMLVFWFNTFFLEHGVTLNSPDGGGTEVVEETPGGGEIRFYDLHKFELDKANKDKKHKFFPANFMIRLCITMPNEKEERECITKSISLNQIIQVESAVDGGKSKTLRNLATEAQNSVKQKSLSLPKKPPTKQPPTDFLQTPCQPGNNSSAPSSPGGTKRLQMSHSQPISPTTPPLEAIYDRSLSRSLEVLRVEDEPLSDDDDEDDQSASSPYPITRV